MAAPTFVASYSSVYNTTTSPKTVSVTTQAGDLVVVCAGDCQGDGTYTAPSGNSISFTNQQSIGVGVNYGGANIWTGTDATGGTSWTFSLSYSITREWGMTVIIFRNAGGVGASNQSNVDNAAPTLDVATTRNNSAVVTWSADWNALDGASRIWRTVNGITPTAGNGFELAYGGTPANTYLGYCAYYNDVGVVGAKTVGLSVPGGQRYSIVGLEVLGFAAPTLTTSAVTAITPTTATGNGNVLSDGGSTITERGFCWSTSFNPTTASSKVTAAGTTGSYSADLTSLSDATRYYVRAYAINSIGTSYGENVTFINLGAALSWFQA